MSRRVRRSVAKNLDCSDTDGDENSNLDEKAILDWKRLPDDTIIQLFSCLNYRDRASLSSTCCAWRALGKSPCLWKVLDLRSHKCDAATAALLAQRCEYLQKIRFRGPESVEAILKLRATNLQELSGDGCREMGDAMLSVLVSRHEALECLMIGPDFCEKLSSDAIKAIAICCPKLQKLRLSGIREVDSSAINALAKNCLNLVNLGFIDCEVVDETAMGDVSSLRFLSVEGTTNINWNVASKQWSKLKNLIGLDVSRTDITPLAASRYLTSSGSLKVLCALNCPLLEEFASLLSNKNHKGNVLLAVFTDILQGVATLMVDHHLSKTSNAFLEWRNQKVQDGRMNELLNWLEWIISSSLLHVSESNPPGMDSFWLNQGTNLLLSFMQSSQEEVQERAAKALATFVLIDDENASIDTGRAEAVIRDGGIHFLLNLARTWQEELQSEAAKAIANLSVNVNVAKTVAEVGGISILVHLARSMNRLVAEEATGGLWNLSVGEAHKVAQAGGVKALVDLIFKWSRSGGGERVLERAAGALANLATDNMCCMEVMYVGGVHALVKLARWSKVEGVQKQAARALATLAGHEDSNINKVIVGQEEGALEALVQLTHSPHDGVKQEAACAIWNLSLDDRNREAIAVAGGVGALVALALSCLSASHGLQEMVAGALWGLSVSEANSIAIGREGGVAPLISLARSVSVDVHESASGALCNLAFNPGNALRIMEEGGVPTLVHLCSLSASKMARFMSALALAHMFDGRMDGSTFAGTSTESTSKNVTLDSLRRMALKHIKGFLKSFSDPQAFSVAAASPSSAALAQVTESARIQEAGHLRCSEVEIGRFIAMLRNPYPTLKECAAFTLLQFTLPGGRHSILHARLLQNLEALRALRSAAAPTGASIEARIFACIVLRNLEQHQHLTGSPFSKF